MAATPPSATPAPSSRSGPGCLVFAVGLPIVVLLGLVIGSVLSTDDEPAEERAVTLDQGTLAGTEWRVDAVVDIEGDTCAFLFADDVQLTGACTLTPQDATFGGETVVFGRAASDATEVGVALSDGEAVTIATAEADGIDGRFYVEVVEGDVDAEGFVP